MEDGKNAKSEACALATVVEPAEAAPVGRRELAALVAAFAGLAATGCVTQAEGEGKEPMEELGQVAQALESGLALRWVDTVLGAMPPDTRTGALATLNSADLSDTIVVIAKGCVTAGDGGGGVFYWDTSSATPDDGGSITSGSKYSKRAGLP